ncbi:MAG: proton-conducting transporter membrane subunit, partial [Cyanobacteria bacterium J06588_5]
MDFANIAAQLNAGIILPEGIVIITILAVIVIDIAGGRRASRWLPYFAIAGLLAAIADLFLQWGAADPIAFLGSFNGDDLSIVFRGIIALSSAVTIPMCIRYIERSGTALAEFLAILLTATLGGMFLSGADELVTVFVSLETLSISSYLLTGYMKRDPRSNEAALKYLLIGAASAAIFLYGMSLLYGLSGGETNLGAIADALALNYEEAPIGLIIALVFVIAGIAFKVAAVPFHQWTPDVYEGSPTPVVAFLSVGSKTAGFALAMRLLLTA